MKLYYYKAPQKNFGDDLNPWLFEKLLPNYFNDDSSAWMSGIGTILNDYMPKAEKKIVFSSGAGQGILPQDIHSHKWHIACVRGPLTARVLDIDAKKAVTDGAILIASLEEFKPIPEPDRSGVIFMPHHKSSKYGKWRDICNKAGIEFVDPEDDFLETLNKIRRSQLVLADAMHGAIVADTLRVPWLPIHATAHINEFKWLDWTLSMDTKYEPISVPCSTIEEKTEKWIHSIFGGLYPSGHDPDKAVRSFERLFGKNKHHIWQFNRRMRKFSTKAIIFFIALLNKTKYGKCLQAKQMEKASHTLFSLAKHKGSLSHDHVFNSKLKLMEQKVKEIKDIS